MTQEETKKAFIAITDKYEELCELTNVRIIGTSSMIYSDGRSHIYHFNYPRNEKDNSKWRQQGQGQ